MTMNLLAEEPFLKEWLKRAGLFLFLLPLLGAVTLVPLYFHLTKGASGLLQNLLGLAYLFLIPAIGAAPMGWMWDLTLAQRLALAIVYYGLALIAVGALGFFAFVIVTGWAI